MFSWYVDPYQIYYRAFRCSICNYFKIEYHCIHFSPIKRISTICSDPHSWIKLTNSTLRILLSFYITIKFTGHKNVGATKSNSVTRFNYMRHLIFLLEWSFLSNGMTKRKREIPKTINVWTNLILSYNPQFQSVKLIIL